MRRPIAFFYGALVLGGTGRVVVQMANAMAEQGLEVDVVLTAAYGEYLDQGMLNPRVHVVDLGYHHYRGLAILPLFRYLRRTRPRVLISQITAYNVRAAAAHLLYRLLKPYPKIPLIIVEHQLLGIDMINLGHAGIKRLMVQALYRFLPIFAYRFADRLAAVSGDLAEALAKSLWMPLKNITVLYNPVLTADLNQKCQLPVPHPWLEEKTLPVILAVGRLHPIKRYDLLLEAFAWLRQSTPARLIILGEGPERKALEQKVIALGLQEVVSLPGASSNPFAYYARADIFALTSRRESLSMVLIEALAAGCPVVSVNCTVGPREVLADGRYGLLLHDDRATTIAGGLQQALTSPEMMQEKVRLFQTEMQPHFTAEKALAAYIALIQEAEL